jgi:integrase
MATIRKHWNKWQVLIRRQGHPHIAKSFTSYSLATKYAQESEMNIEKGIFADMSEANQTTLRDTLRRYKDEVTVSKKGAKQETYKINKLMRHKICNYSLARLTPNKIAKLRNELKLSSAPATVNKYLTLISVAVNTARNEWGIHLPINPCSKIKRMEEPEVLDIRVAPEEEALLLKHAERSKKHWLKAIIIVALELGCRRGELFRLLKTDVDLFKSTAVLRNTKNGTDRKIGLSPKSVHALQTLIPSIDGRFFPTESESFKFYWKQLKQWSGVNKNFHHLRHEWASRMFEKGWDISSVATQGGWKDWKVLRRYTAISPEYLAEKFRKQS